MSDTPKSGNAQKKGSKEWRFLRDSYHVTQSMIIQKIFLIAPWKGPGSRFSRGEWSSKAWIFKLFCHLVLLILVTALIILINWQWAGYQRAANAISCRYFLPNNEFCSFDECIGYLSTIHPSVDSYSCSLFQRQDVQVSILNSVRQYYHINTTSIAQFQHPFENAAGNAFHNCQPNSLVPSASIVITSTNGEETAVNLFPNFSLEEGEEKINLILKEENVRHISNIQLNFPLVDTLFIDIYKAQYIWNFQINYDKDSAISSFEVSSSQKITHICGIENHHPLQNPADGSGGRGYVYSYEFGIQVTSVLIIVVSTLYLISLLLDLLDNFRVTFYVLDMLRLVIISPDKQSMNSSPAVNSVFEEIKEIVLESWNRLLYRCERYMRMIIQVPLVSRAECDRISKILLAKQLENDLTAMDASDAAEQAAREGVTAAYSEVKIGLQQEFQEKLAPADLYNISHLLEMEDKSAACENDPNSSRVDDNSRGSFASSSQSTANAGANPVNISGIIPSVDGAETIKSAKPSISKKDLTPADYQRRLLKFWQQLSFRVKLRLLDGWRLLSIVGAVVALSAACIFTQVTHGYFAVYFPGGVIGTDSPRLMLGLAAAIQYLALLSYFRYSNRFTSSALVLWGAFFKVQRIFVSILPLAVGLALLGIVVFGNSAETFGDLESMTITLFSLMNCDSIWQIFVDTTTFSSSNVALVGTLYVTAIFIVFNYLLLRLVLAVVESLYYYLRLYTNARRKRGLFRAKILQRQENGDELKEYATAFAMRAHTSQEIQLSLFRIYAKQFLPPSDAAVSPTAPGARDTVDGWNRDGIISPTRQPTTSLAVRGPADELPGNQESRLANTLMTVVQPNESASSSTSSNERL